MTTILIIDDEPSMRGNIASLLCLEGFRVLQAANGQSGLDILHDHQVDLILCDIAMPDTSGGAASPGPPPTKRAWRT